MKGGIYAIESLFDSSGISEPGAARHEYANHAHPRNSREKGAARTRVVPRNSIRYPIHGTINMSEAALKTPDRLYPSLSTRSMLGGEPGSQPGVLVAGKGSQERADEPTSSRRHRPSYPRVSIEPEVGPRSRGRQPSRKGRIA
jgi:hypothetical protein